MKELRVASLNSMLTLMCTFNKLSSKEMPLVLTVEYNPSSFTFFLYFGDDKG